MMGGPYDFSLPLPNFRESMNFYTGTINTTQEVLKAIAKASDFNVNIQAIQARQTLGCTLYRAFCTVCQKELFCTAAITMGNFDKEFMEFCVAHRHEPVTAVPEEPTGRKFKDI